MSFNFYSLIFLSFSGTIVDVGSGLMQTRAGLFITFINIIPHMKNRIRSAAFYQTALFLLLTFAASFPPTAITAGSMLTNYSKVNHNVM